MRANHVGSEAVAVRSNSGSEETGFARMLATDRSEAEWIGSRDAAASANGGDGNSSMLSDVA